MKTIAIVPVKKVSSRLKDKNILPFGNCNLLEHKIRQLKRTPNLDCIVVSSDSDVMLEMAAKEGAIPLKRPAEFADESRSFSDFIEYLCGAVDCDHIAYTAVTSPFVDGDTYAHAIETYFTKLREGYDSLISVVPFREFLLNEQGPVNFKTGKDDTAAQDPYAKFLPNYWLLTCGIMIAPRQSMAAWKYHFGPNPFYYEVDKKVSIDIDDVYDYVCATALYAHDR